MKHPMTVLYIASQEDEPLQRQLEKHLALLEQQGLMQGWHVQQILAGSVEAESRDAALQKASLVLLLISADFFSSPMCQEQMQRALERQKRGEVQVIPILVRRVDGKGALFAHLQALPRNGKPIASWLNEDEVLTEVAEGIRRVLEEDHLPMATASRTGLPPIWNIPYPRNLLFVGQDDVLIQLHQQLHAGHATALSQSSYALSGLGGIGKTQIAVEYTYRYAQEYEVVLWAQAESQETLQASYVEMASLLNLPEKEAQEQEKIIQAVKMWLQRHRDWLLILDNADTLKILPSFLPPALGGHLLLTTRASAMGRLAQRIEVQTLDEAQGALLLLRRAGRLIPDGILEQASEVEQILARQMSEALGGLPLALDQAGAYLEETGCGLASYTTIYQQHRKELLSKRGGLVQDHRDAVATTWSLSFKKVEEQSPVAADLLRVCAFLSPDAIPEELFLQGAAVLGPQLAPVAGDVFLFNQVIEVLRGYSLVSRDVVGMTVSIHRLVQVVLRDALDGEMQRQWKLRVIQAINAVFPIVEFVRWDICERLILHALLCARWIDQEQIVLPEAVRLLNQAGIYRRERAQYRDAASLFRQALAICRILPSELEVAHAFNNLATAFVDLGEYEEAEDCFKQALEIRRRSLGEEHADTALSLNNLAALYDLQGHYVKAEPFYQQAITIDRNVYGENSRELATDQNNLGTLYRAQRRHKEAEQVLNRVLEVRMRYLGPKHPDTGSTLSNRAHLYKEQGRYEEAEVGYRQALAIYEEIDVFSPSTANTLNNLAALYLAQRKSSEAEPLLKRAVEIWEQSLGVGHPTTKMGRGNYADLLRAMGREEEAAALEVEGE